MWDHLKGNHYTFRADLGHTHRLPRVREELQQGLSRGTELRNNKGAHIRSIKGNGAASAIDTEQVPVLLAI